MQGIQLKPLGRLYAVFNKVINNEKVSEACALFSGIFGSILNKHAPLKVFQVRNNYSPWLSKETKELIKVRNMLRKEATEEACNDKYENYKRLRNEINQRLEKDRKEYYKSIFTVDMFFSARRYLLLVTVEPMQIIARIVTYSWVKTSALHFLQCTVSVFHSNPSTGVFILCRLISESCHC